MPEFYPTGMKQASDTELAVTWNDGHVSVFPVRHLRLHCKCANCVEEMSGRPTLDPASVPPDVRPVSISPVGRYALHIAWTDGHTTGIYTFEHLRSLCTCATCAAARHAASQDA
jgi:DUF971 family protein